MSLIPEDIIARVLERTDIAELIGSYTPLKRTGKNLKACCPFHHEKTPSFVVTPQKQIFHCFGCGVGGNAISFVMKQERMEFPEAVRLLAAKAGITVPERGDGAPAQESLREKVFAANAAAVEYFHQNLVAGRGAEVEAARAYLKGRQLNLEAARRFKLGYAYAAWDGLIEHLRARGFEPDVIAKSGLVVPRTDGKGVYDRFRGRVIFPIFDHRGRPVAFGARALNKDDKAKYINSPETPVYTKGRHLYGFNWSKDSVGREDRAIIVEGYLDFIRPFVAGVENVAASQGTALTADQIRLIRRYTRRVTMLFDMDAAGQSAAVRSLDALLEEDMEVMVMALTEGEDPDSFIQKYGADDFRRRAGEARPWFDFKFERLSRESGGRLEGRGTIAREMLATIEKVKSEVVKDGYLRELAARLNVGEEVIRRERQHLLDRHPPSAARSSGEAPAPVRPERLSPDEEWLLRLVLADSRWLAESRATVALDDLVSPAARQVMAAAYRLLDEGRPTGPAVLVEEFLDEGLRRRIMALATAPGIADARTAAKAFADCVGRIAERARKAKRQGLKDTIRHAERAGDQDALRRAQEEFNQLLKGEGHEGR